MAGHIVYEIDAYLQVTPGHRSIKAASGSYPCPARPFSWPTSLIGMLRTTSLLLLRFSWLHTRLSQQKSSSSSSRIVLCASKPLRNPIGTEMNLSISVRLLRTTGVLVEVLEFSCPTEVLVP